MTALPLTAPLDRLSKACVLCVGDLMLDRFVYGSVERISPEAPIPVLRVTREQSMLGGAGNVVRNLRSLGVATGFIGMVGDDAAGRQLLDMIGKEEGIEPFVFTEKGRVSTAKTRYIAGQQQLLRADEEHRTPLKPALETQVLDMLKAELPRYQALVFSDYAKGMLTDRVLKEGIALARAASIPVLVDPKRPDFSAYQGATLLTPNQSELAAACGRPLATQSELAEAASGQIAACGLDALLVTRGREGMLLVTRDGEVMPIAAKARDVFDVSGAGDTSLATLAAGLAAGLTLLEAATLANAAAGVVVGKLGTAAIQPEELQLAVSGEEGMGGAHKIRSCEQAESQVALWRGQGLKIGFTNGCFDVLHPGHLSLLEQARAACDRLVVGLNSDASIKRLKGPDRPYHSEQDRARMLAALSAVDAVVLFGEDTPLALIDALRPERLVKGADYTKAQVVGGDRVESWGGEVILVPLKQGHSTTNILKRA